MLLQSLERKARTGTADVETILRASKQVTRLTGDDQPIMLDLSRLPATIDSFALHAPVDLGQVRSRGRSNRSSEADSSATGSSSRDEDVRRSQVKPTSQRLHHMP